MRLVIGNKNYSSWSMRAGVLMHELGIAFEEHKLRLDFAEGSPFPCCAGPVHAGRPRAGAGARRRLRRVGHAGDHRDAARALSGPRRLARRRRGTRARARSLCAEMHAGFAALREHCPMNIEAALPDAGARVWAEQPGVRRDVQRLEQAWGDALAASGGPMLFGAFSAADAFFAPVCMRLVTYALPVSDTTRAYVERLTARPGVAAWIADARAEKDFIAEDEPYRSSR
jgi:glutathione S-transferase